ncbi:DHH family phosphoesterase [Erysipelotrichaceae bacterium OttesenSCG-928-M19]|nr:DHH family phosphoesterase [Erysipelotrichaceae bacterium OttesenSCG-928-M19]
MYQKIRKIENRALFIVISNIVFILFYYVGLPLIIVFALLIILNIILVYLISKNANVLKKSINKSKSILPASVIKAIDIDKYCMVMYDNEDHKIVWENEYFVEQFGSHLDEDITKIFSGFFFIDNIEGEYLEYNDRYYSVIKNEETFLLKDVSDYIRILKNYENEKDCILFIRIDGVDDVSAGMDEIEYQEVIQKVRKMINEYASNFDSILRRYKNDSYIMIVKHKDYTKMLDQGIELLDNIKKANEEDKDQLTLSIGIGLDFDILRDAEKEAGYALDMALARGGDQIVVKAKGEAYKFYGSGSEAIEKRNRVKVRTLAKSLEGLIEQSSNIVIMPHKNPDLDALGASFGMSKFVAINNREAIICSDEKGLEKTTNDAYYSLGLDEKKLLKNKNEVLTMIDENTLLIVLDTSNIELFESAEVYEKIEKRVIVDHHRRSKEFLKNPLLVYIEPYASSTVELVTELLSFQTKSFRLDSDVATLMLAGMMVDSSYFTVRTGVRTFEAAMLLKEHGASPLQAKEILQVSRDTYEKKLAIIQNATYIDDEIAISKYEEGPVSRTLLAQVAVELLDVKDIIATFVIANLEDGTVGISARSSGDFNVQIILEEFGGGGHFSMAAAQINGDVKSVEKALIKKIKAIKEGMK